MKNWRDYILVMLSPLWLHSQITVSNAPPMYSPVSNLLQNVLIGGGVSISNVTSVGNSGIGFFNGVNSNIGLDSGVVMSTGGINHVVPNGSTSIIGNAGGSDPDLLALLASMGLPSASINNLVRITCNVVPVGNCIRLNFVFASREYQSSVCSQFNDVFGLFISGPGINGPYSNNGKNIALIPGTNVPISVNSINGGIAIGGNTSLCLAANPNYVAHSTYFVQNSAMATVNMPGFTVPIQAVSLVEPGQTYALKFAIADVRDGVNNAAVFLEGSGLNSCVPSVSHRSNIPITPHSDTVSESCGPFPVIFKKDFSVLDTMRIYIHTAGTAVDGVDYVSIPDTFFTPGNKEFDTLWITPIHNIVPQPPRSLKLFFSLNTTNVNTVFFDSLTLWIRDPIPLNGMLINQFSADSLYCAGSQVTLSAVKSGGEIPSFGWWQDLDTTTTRTFTLTHDTVIRYYITDACLSDTLELSKNFYVCDDIALSLSARDTAICEGQGIFLSADYSCAVPPVLIQWINVADESNNQWVFPLEDITYYVIVTDSCGLLKQDSVTVTVYPRPKAAFTADVNQMAREVTFNNKSENATQFIWFFGDGNTSTQVNPTHQYQKDGDYQITLVAENQYGCKDTLRQMIRVRQDYLLYIPNSFTPNGDGKNDLFQVVAEGIEGYHIQIFNRWGQMVFESDDIMKSWDGRYLNQDAPQGLYLYKILITLKNNVKEERSGTIHLIR